MKNNRININLFIEYEILSSRWVKYMRGRILQQLSGRYFARKAKRKYDRAYKVIASRAWLEEEIRKYNDKK